MTTVPIPRQVIDGDAVLAQSRCIFQSSYEWYFIDLVGKFGDLLVYAIWAADVRKVDFTFNVVIKGYMYDSALRCWQVYLGLIHRRTDEIDDLYIKVAVLLNRIWPQQISNSKIPYSSKNFHRKKTCVGTLTLALMDTGSCSIWDLHLFYYTLRPVSLELVMFPDFEFRTSLVTSILLFKAMWVNWNLK